MLTFARRNSHLIIGILMVLISLEKYTSGTTTLSQFLTTVQGLFGFTGMSVAALGDIFRNGL